MSNVFAFLASRGAIHIPVDTVEKWAPASPPSVRDFPFRARYPSGADSAAPRARRLIRFIRNEARTLWEAAAIFLIGIKARGAIYEVIAQGAERDTAADLFRRSRSRESFAKPRNELYISAVVSDPPLEWTWEPRSA